MAKQGIWIGAALVACALTVFFFIDGRSGSATKRAKSGVAATLDPVAKDPVAKDDPASDAPMGFEILELDLPEYDPKTNLNANRGKGRKARTKLEWIRTNFRKDRELRITMAKSLVRKISEPLGLRKEQEEALVELLVKRGDAVRPTYFRKEGGLATKPEVNEARKKSAEEFEREVGNVLDNRQYGIYKQFEKVGCTADGTDLGFGVVYGMGFGKERWKEAARAREK